MKKTSFNGKCLVITILTLAVIFSVALSVSVKSIVNKMKTEASGAALPTQDARAKPRE